MPEVTIIIPNYNGAKLLKNCIKTLEEQTFRDFVTLIVDNGSTDDSRQVTSDVLDLKWILLEENTGFCGAVNTGIKACDTPYFILLNNDTEADSHYVEELLCAIKKDEKLFSCSARMIDFHDHSLMDNAGDYYTAFGWAMGRGKNRPLSAYDKEKNVFSSCGGAAIYRTSVIDEIGYFDNNHFAYLEDVDMGYRARICGYKNRYIPTAKVLHVGSATTGTRYNERKVFLAARNSMYVIYKNMPSLQVIINLPFILLGIIIKSLFFLRKGFAGEYLSGIGQGIAKAPTLEKFGFKMSNLGHYFKIQLELWVNIVKVPLHL